MGHVIVIAKGCSAADLGSGGADTSGDRVWHSRGARRCSDSTIEGMLVQDVERAWVVLLTAGSCFE